MKQRTYFFACEPASEQKTLTRRRMWVKFLCVESHRISGWLNILNINSNSFVAHSSEPGRRSSHCVWCDAVWGCEIGDRRRTHGFHAACKTHHFLFRFVININPRITFFFVSSAHFCCNSKFTSMPNRWCIIAWTRMRLHVPFAPFALALSRKIAIARPMWNGFCAWRRTFYFQLPAVFGFHN